MSTEYIYFWVIIMGVAGLVYIISHVTRTIQEYKKVKHTRSISESLNYLAYVVSQERGDGIVKPPK